jgi:hypothetical protein
MVSEALFQKVATSQTDTSQSANSSTPASTGGAASTSPTGGAASTSPAGAVATSGQSVDFLATLKNMGAKDVVIDQMNSLVSFK